MTGVATLLLAPFGGFALNLSAITAAIVMGKEAHVDPDKRYTAAVSCGAIYLVIGVFGAAVSSLLAAFPQRAGRCHCRAGPTGHDWRWRGCGGERRSPP